MSYYVRVEDKKVVYKSPHNVGEGLIEVVDSVCFGMVQNDDGTFSVPPKKTEDLLTGMRVERNRLLVSSDWTGLVDSAITSEVSAQWKLYRQKLRDLPSGLNTPAKVKSAKWPVKPV